MAAKKSSRMKSTSVGKADTGPKAAKILVSSLAMHYQLPPSNGTIVFDKEIVPGIFTPSMPVPKNLAEQYRVEPSACGVMIFGSLKREMTQAEIPGLLPSQRDAVKSDMLSPDKDRVFYNVIRVTPDHIAPHELAPNEKSALVKALRQSPSETFIEEIERAMGKYLWDREQVTMATPKRVHSRIMKVREQIEALCRAINELQDSDSSLIGMATNIEFLKKHNTIQEREIFGQLTIFHRHVSEAEALVAPSALRGGRMPSYAEEVFARHIAELLQQETGTRPTVTRARKKEGDVARGSTYFQVLKILLNAADRGSVKPRKDVEALARGALKSLPSLEG